ncbi:hypothetical protein BDZ89DRAFT_1142894 [Hymenopellis radicata]|nr:hypothetical protein BDZ89DRAFT_1142894 [Hymenopellis radicata]
MAGLKSLHFVLDYDTVYAPEMAAQRFIYDYVHLAPGRRSAERVLDERMIDILFNRHGIFLGGIFVECGIETLEDLQRVASACIDVRFSTMLRLGFGLPVSDPNWACIEEILKEVGCCEDIKDGRSTCTERHRSEVNSYVLRVMEEDKGM